MKRLFLLTFVVLNFLYSTAQLSTVGTKWTYSWVSYDAPKFYYGAEIYVIEKDTILNSNVYSVIGNSFGNSFWTQQNNKIYYYFNSQKLLFFDFNAK